MKGLQSGLIRIGTFSSVSCHWLPGLMRDFKVQYPAVHFELHQGNYADISDWINERKSGLWLAEKWQPDLLQKHQ